MWNIIDTRKTHCPGRNCGRFQRLSPTHPNGMTFAVALDSNDKVQEKFDRLGSIGGVKIGSSNNDNPTIESLSMYKEGKRTKIILIGVNIGKVIGKYVKECEEEDIYGPSAEVCIPRKMLFTGTRSRGVLPGPH